jgi:hypothetical protein
VIVKSVNHIDVELSEVFGFLRETLKRAADDSGYRSRLTFHKRLCFEEAFALPGSSGTS